MAKKRQKTTQLSILLLKDGNTIDTALKVGSESFAADDRKELTHAGKKIGDFFLAPQHGGNPKWYKALSPYVTKLPPRTNSIASGILFIPIESRLFAVTFGYGRGMLVKECWETGFGLRVTLNAASEEGIRSVNKKSLDSFAHQTQTQGVGDGKLGSFGVDFSHDLLNAVAATPGDSSHGLRLVGKDALGAQFYGAIADILPKLPEYLKLYASKAYKQKYPEIDRMSSTTDSTTIFRLNNLLAEKFRKNDLDRVSLTAPVLLDWERVRGFRYNRDDEDARDLTAENFLSTVKDVSKIDFDFLRRHRVYVVDASTDQSFDDWPLHHCIHAEIEEGKHTWIYSGGEWFNIDRDFVNEVDADVQRWMTAGGALSMPKYIGGKERPYNKILEGALGGEMLDGASVHFGGKHSQIEFCDVITSSKLMLHTKRYAKSSILSHLFAQGGNAAETLFLSPPFRSLAQDRIKDTALKKIIDPKSINPSEFSVGFVILGREGEGKTPVEALPFFSRLTLRRFGLRLEGFGYKVLLILVPEER